MEITMIRLNSIVLIFGAIHAVASENVNFFLNKMLY